MIGHSNNVNSVRFCPGANILASGSDDSQIFLWKLTDESPETLKNEVAFGDDAEDLNIGLEVWRRAQVLRSQSDVYDLAWSYDGAGLMSGSHDGKFSLWGAEAISLSSNKNQAQASAAAAAAQEQAEGEGAMTAKQEGESATSENADGTPRTTAVGFRAGTGMRLAVTLMDHEELGQGTAWDPLGQYVITQSGDQTARLYQSIQHPVLAAARSVRQRTNPLRLRASLVKGSLSWRMSNELVDRETLLKAPSAADAPVFTDTTGQTLSTFQLFARETSATYFRRPAFSPDGSFIVCPAGQYPKPASCQGDGGNSGSNSGNSNNQSIPTQPCAYVYHRSTLRQPLCVLPMPRGEPAIAVRFCPTVFAPRGRSLEHGNNPDDASSHATERGVCGLGYRQLCAVLTTRSIVVYDSSTWTPLALLENLHMLPLTDAAWTQDGTRLVVASQDGYLSFVSFDEEDLGPRLSASELAVFQEEMKDRRTRIQAANSALLNSRSQQAKQQAQLEAAAAAAGGSAPATGAGSSTAGNATECVLLGPEQDVSGVFADPSGSNPDDALRVISVKSGSLPSGEVWFEDPFTSTTVTLSEAEVKKIRAQLFGTWEKPVPQQPQQQQQPEATQVSSAQSGQSTDDQSTEKLGQPRKSPSRSTKPKSETKSGEGDAAAEGAMKRVRTSSSSKADEKAKDESKSGTTAKSTPQRKRPPASATTPSTPATDSTSGETATQTEPAKSDDAMAASSSESTTEKKTSEKKAAPRKAPKTKTAATEPTSTEAEGTGASQATSSSKASTPKTSKKQSSSSTSQAEAKMPSEPTSLAWASPSKPASAPTSEVASTPMPTTAAASGGVESTKSPSRSPATPQQATLAQFFARTSPKPQQPQPPRLEEDPNAM